MKSKLFICRHGDQLLYLVTRVEGAPWVRDLYPSSAISSMIHVFYSWLYVPSKRIMHLYSFMLHPQHCLIEKVPVEVPNVGEYLDRIDMHGLHGCDVLYPDIYYGCWP